MEKKYKTYAKLNLVSLFFIAVSFISITLAWFAYSGLTKVSTEIGVKAWYIEFDKEVVSNQIILPISDIYPGMDTISEKVNIKNLGDSDAQVSYSIESVRLLNTNVEETITKEELEDYLSHNYPFHINISLSKEYIESATGEGDFLVSVSWPLDSADDSEDSKWGKDSFEFKESEQAKYTADPTYTIEPQIKIVINIKAEQYTENNESVDIKYNLGDIVLYDTSTGLRCSSLGGTCIKTYVIDVSNKIKDTSVTLLPDLYATYAASSSYTNYDANLSTLTSTWNVTTRALKLSDVLKVISADKINSVLVRENLSNTVIGNLNYGNRLNTEVNKIISEATNKFTRYEFLNTNFSYLVTSRCYWINDEYDTDNVFSLVKIDNTTSKISTKLKTDSCEIVPVIIASKVNLEA